MPDQNDVQDMVEKGVDQAKKSGADWLNYVETHPIQSVFFGLIGYFAIKGMMK